MTTGTPDDAMPEPIFKSLPIIIQEMACKCASPNLLGYHSLAPVGTPLQRFPFATICTNCLRPHKYTIHNVVEECEGCGNYYIPKFHPDTYPIRYYLCSKCDVKPLRRKP